MVKRRRGQAATIVASISSEMCSVTSFCESSVSAVPRGDSSPFALQRLAVSMSPRPRPVMIAKPARASRTPIFWATYCGEASPSLYARGVRRSRFPQSITAMTWETLERFLCRWDVVSAMAEVVATLLGWEGVKQLSES